MQKHKNNKKYKNTIYESNSKTWDECLSCDPMKTMYKSINLSNLKFNALNFGYIIINYSVLH